MSLKNKLTALTFSLLLLAPCVGARAQGGANGLVVEVRNEEGRPLRNACVTVIPKEGEITFRKANGDGQVKLKKIVPGSYRVVVKVDGYEAQKRVISVGEGVERVAFSLQPRELKANE